MKMTNNTYPYIWFRTFPIAYGYPSLAEIGDGGEKFPVSYILNGNYGAFVSSLEIGEWTEIPPKYLHYEMGQNCYCFARPVAPEAQGEEYLSNAIRKGLEKYTPGRRRCMVLGDIDPWGPNWRIAANPIVVLSSNINDNMIDFPVSDYRVWGCKKVPYTGIIVNPPRFAEDFEIRSEVELLGNGKVKVVPKAAVWVTWLHHEREVEYSPEGFRLVETLKEGEW